MGKKVVRYVPSKTALPPMVGRIAVVFPVDHPDSERVSNTKLVYTSEVVRIGEDGEFETVNTIYRPAQEVTS